MKRAVLPLLFAGLVAFLPSNLSAQTNEEVMHAPSGGSVTRISSISVPPIPNAPFTATVNTEWTRKLEDGATMTTHNQRIIARDGSGRVFEERRNFTPASEPPAPMAWQLEYADPQTHVIYRCHPANRSCNLGDYFAPAKLTPPPPAGDFGGGKMFVSRVALGTDTVGGLEAIGSRETTTLAAGAMGNDRPVETVKEFWYSPQLGINLIEKRQDPKSGTQKFEVDNIQLGEPDAKFFDLPPNYEVIDEREQPAAGNGSHPN
jgi:hypothetical protein